MNLKKMIMIIAIIAGVLVIAITGFAKYKQISPLSWGLHHKVNQGVFSKTAIMGYDPVTYFTEEQAIKGKEMLKYTWHRTTWYFSSEENLNLFSANPEKYAPRFGGYCAFAVSKGFTAGIDPEAYTLLDGRLYLFSEPKFRDEWLKGGEESLMKSQQNWK